ncbi:AHH domain-containing protein [Tsuneonella sp. YG55]|uniref:AHH domain-containing protein n=1 Tax=Tsuneonella litorea TaxID=2976475 RepID=A0A9X3AKP9_9SPHN|nr:AHH domain-containing protein [Tsuneonella litorea]MCT2558078.1 AHH domain-containing protein [Tsuneonella litorea]
MTAAVEYAQRERLPFRAVNRPGAADYDPALQRHHLLPRQLLGNRCFGRLLGALDPRRLGFDDFRRNGVLLPARTDAASRLGLPLHRGPHRAYNAMVIERVGMIEAQWVAARPRAPVSAGEDALFRLALLQRALRRRLLDPARTPLRLNRHDPVGTGFDFTRLDAMVDQLWGATQSALAESSSLAA